MKSLLALAVMLSSIAAFGVATTSSAEAHFNKKRHHHAKHYKHAKACKKGWLFKHKRCHRHR